VSTEVALKLSAKERAARAQILWSVTRGQRGRYVLAFCAMVVGTLLLYLQPLVIGSTVDNVIREAGNGAQPKLVAAMVDALGGPAYLRAHLWIAALAIIGVNLLSGVCTFVSQRATAKAAESVVQTLRNRLYDQLQHLPMSWHAKAQTGDTVQRCTSDIETVRMLYSNQLVEIARALTLLFVAIPLMFMLDGVMTLVALALLPVIIAFSIIFLRRVTGRFKKADEAEGRMTTVLQENLTGIRVVRAFARQDHERTKFAEKNTTHRKLNYGLFKIMAAFWATSDLLTFIQLTLILVTGAWRIRHGYMDVGVLVTFLGYAGIYIWPIRQIGRVLTDTGKSMVAIGRIQEILDAPREADAAQPTSLPIKSDRKIVFENVSFAHGETAILKNITFTAEPGQTLALLGPSGSGKTTIIALMLRLFDPTSGRILLDGVDIATLSRKRVREQFGVVLQEPFLYGKTITQNIRLGRGDAPIEDVIEAAQISHVHASIEKFDKKYDTLLGERGVTLSGGQRQRVAIARALLKDSPILILDDALSAVDTHTESQILDALKCRSGKQTTLLIAHRLSTLMHADRILVIEHGQIVQTGTHASLVDQDGMYRRLWQIQTALEEDLKADMDPQEATVTEGNNVSTI
jgi:ATP-binding cassette, subfamily B, bacterial